MIDVFRTYHTAVARVLKQWNRTKRLDIVEGDPSTLVHKLLLGTREQEEQCLVPTTRMPWPQFWMNFARALASDRGYDERLKVGALVVAEDNTSVLALGYNGNYKGGPNKAESNEPGQSVMLHAEINCLIKMDFRAPGKKTMYVTHFPCPLCSKAIINAGIHRVVYGDVYRDMAGRRYLDDASVQVLSLHEALAELKSPI